MRIYLLAILIVAVTFCFGQSPNDDGRVYTIPVVLHIMNPVKGKSLVTQVQAQAAIDYLNKVFSSTYPGMELNTERGAAGDIGIRFKLATQDEKGNPTNGIDIVYVNEKMPSIKAEYAENGVAYQYPGKGCNENILKGLARWNRNHYLNIWVVNKIDGNKDDGGTFTKMIDKKGFSIDNALNNIRTMAAGTIPDLFSQERRNDFYIGKDGLMVLAFLLKDGFEKRKSDLAHEIGHYLNLYHVFQGQIKKESGEHVCPVNMDFSSDGDKVADTDPVTEIHYFPGDEPKDRTEEDNPCTGTLYTVNTEHNFMSYNPNRYLSLFTNGQKERMRNCLNDSNLRKELVCTFKQTSDDNIEENNLRRFGNNAVFRNGKKLLLQLKSGKKTIVLTNHRLTDTDDGDNYFFTGYSDDLNSFIIENAGYESLSFSFINRNNGAETVVPSVHFKVFPSNKMVVFYNDNGDENGNAFFFSDNGLKSAF